MLLLVTGSLPFAALHYRARTVHWTRSAS